MLEILALIALTRKIGEIVQAKGRKTGWYKFMTVALWIGGELLGAIIGGEIAAVTNSESYIAYLFALLGAVIGAVAAYLIARAVPPLVYNAPPAPPVFK